MSRRQEEKPEAWYRFCAKKYQIHLNIICCSVLHSSIAKREFTWFASENSGNFTFFMKKRMQFILLFFVHFFLLYLCSVCQKINVFSFLLCGLVSYHKHVERRTFLLYCCLTNLKMLFLLFLDVWLETIMCLNGDSSITFLQICYMHCRMQNKLFCS